MNKILKKNKREQDREFLDYCQGKPCLICGYEQTTVGHHIKTKKSGGPDEPWNIVPLCHVHHDQVHRMGTVRFANIHPKFTAYLKYFGWEFIMNSYNGKWIPPKTEDHQSEE